MTQQGIYIFDTSNSFIEAMEQLSKEYKPKPLIKLAKHLTNYTDLFKEINFLNNCSIDSFNGFRKQNQIKLSVTGSDGVRYHIVYSFNNSNGGYGGVYTKFYRYLRKRENIYI
jgi:hypothetical protein